MCKIIANLAMLIRTKISVFAVASWSVHDSVSFVSVDSKSFPPFRLMTPSTLTQTAFLRSCAVNWLMHFHGTGAEEFRLSWNSHDGGKDDDGLRPARLRPRPGPRATSASRALELTRWRGGRCACSLVGRCAKRERACGSERCEVGLPARMRIARKLPSTACFSGYCGYQSGIQIP
jgi:hypothetical protein